MYLLFVIFHIFVGFYKLKEMDNLLQALGNRALGSRLEKQISVSLYPITSNAEIVAEQPTLKQRLFSVCEKRFIYFKCSTRAIFPLDVVKDMLIYLVRMLF